MKPVRCGCGGEAVVDSWLGGLHQANVYYVHCERCDAKTTNYFTETEAVSAWNTAMGITHEKAVDYLQTTGWMRWHDREIATSEQSTGEWIPIPAFENMRCSNCRTVYGANLYPRNFCPRCGASMKGEYSR